MNKDFDHIQTAIEILDQVQDICKEKHGFKIPLKLKFNLRGSGAVGKACFVSGGEEEHSISLSKRVVLQMSYTEIRDLVIHEFAHLLCKYLFPNNKASHGNNWKSCVYSLGGTNVKATYSNPTLMFNKTDVLAKCKCDFKYRFISLKIAKSIENGGQYLCTCCHKRIKLAKEKDFIKFEELKNKGEKNVF